MNKLLGANELIPVTAWQVKTIVTITLMVCCLVTASACAGDRIIVGGLDGLDPLDTTEHYPVLLALSGGGARGLATIGILQAFEEKGISVAAVTGTSIGGIVGGLYAAGYSPEELRSLVHSISFDQFLSNAPARKTMFLTQREERGRHLVSVRFDGFIPVIPQGLTAGQKFTSLLTTLTTKANYHCAGDFGKLPIPFKTISTDIVTGHEVIHGHGSLAEAMRATMGFPLAFTGLEKDRQLLMDGGIITPIPVELAKKMSDSVTFVVAINTASRLLPKEELTTPIDIASQVTSIMTADKLATQLEAADFVIAPPIDEFSSTDFKFKDSLIEMGYQAGKVAADSIVSRFRQECNQTRYSIVYVGGDSLPPAVGAAIMKRFTGEPVSRAELVSALKSVAVDLRLFRLEVDLRPLGLSGDGGVKTLLRVTAYRCFRLSDIEFTFVGNTIFDDTMLASQFNFEDSLLTPQLLQQGIDRILNLYNAHGFDLTDVREVTVDQEQKKITVVIDEAIIKRIDVDGNERTKDWFIRSLFPLKVGQPYSSPRASQGIANIYGTDLFDQIMVDLKPYRGGAIVNIRVQEKKHRQMRLGWHWHDEYGSEEFAEILDDNIGGIGLQFLLHARYAPDRQRYLAGFKADRIFSTYLTSKFHVYRYQLDRHLFDMEGSHTGDRREIKTGIELRLGQQIFRLGTVTTGLTLEEVEYRHPDKSATQKFGLRIFTIGSLVETFNRVPFPESGKKHLFELAFAGEYLGGEVEFTRFFTSLEAYSALGKYLNYHPKLSLGLSRSDLPVSEKFYLGGIHSFAGFCTHQLSGDKLFLLNNELRVKLPLRLYFISRYDMGEVYTATDQIKLRNLRHGVGISLALDAPIGPVEFGYGVADTDEERFYLNVGFSF